MASAVGKVEFLRERLHAIMCDRLVQGRSLLPESYPGILGFAVIVLVPTPVFIPASVSTTAASRTMRVPNAAVEQSEVIARPPMLGRGPVMGTSCDGLVEGIASGEIELIVDDSNRARLSNGIHELDLGVGRVSCADFSEDGRFVAIGFTDGIVQLFECGALSAVSEFRFGCSKIESVSVTADAKKLAVGTRDGEFHLIDLEAEQHTPRFIRRFRGQRARSVSFSRDGQSIAIVWQRRSSNRIEFVQLRDHSIDSSSWLDTKFAVAFDDVVSRTAPPHWRFATHRGEVYVWSETFERTPEFDVDVGQLRAYRMPHKP